MKNARHFQSAKEPVINQLGLASQLLFFFLLVLWLFALVLGVKPAQANPSQERVLIEIRNASYDAGNHYFDIYLRQAGENKIYLGPSDLVITLGYAADAVQELNYVAGSSRLFSNSGLPIYSYGQAISSKLISRNGVYQLVVNVYGPSFDEQDFDDEVAAIDGSVNMHRLGRFFIPNVSNQFNLAGSALYVQGVGLKSAVYSYDKQDNFNLKAVGLLYSSEQSFSVNPVSSFDAQRLSGGIRLSWQLAAAVQAVEIQKSFDGKNWEEVNVQPIQIADGFSAEDMNPSGARVFDGLNQIGYRLMVNSEDGKVYYSSVKHLNYQKGISMVAFPNPAVDELRIRFNDGELVDFQVQIFDARGQLVNQLFGSHQAELQLDLYSLPAGQYVIRVLAGAEMGVSRVMVQK